MFMSAAPEIRGVGRPAVLLGAAGALASMAVMPYAMTLSPGLFARMPLPLPLFLIVQCLQAFVLLTLLSWVGFRLADTVGLKVPTLHAGPGRTALLSPARRSLGMAVVTGGQVGLALLVLGKVSEPLMPAMIGSVVPDIELWKRLLASFYGGIAEELMCRLFLMSLLVWLANRFLARTGAIADARAIWTGIIGAALVFGALHLPAAGALFPLTPMVVARIIAMNAVGGVVFGWLYWRRGLEHAMVAHFFADIVLHGTGGS
ncbi:CPBP family intramembrane glutamic endopeptidase [Rugamonas sp.]|uniref:CPBP family intramembrane glutamic endopeptidase n=1 Tax=Rugamonas sp. TaxID=1926287 RepID=UPI0025E63A03|nr:CPBP family intramembrane glutamic endopeptidase [Rugamonas sp.]